MRRVLRKLTPRPAAEQSRQPSMLQHRERVKPQRLFANRAVLFRAEGCCRNLRPRQAVGTAVIVSAASLAGRDQARSRREILALQNVDETLLVADGDQLVLHGNARRGTLAVEDCESPSRFSIPDPHARAA